MIIKEQEQIVDKLIEIICEVLEVSYGDIISTSRKRELTETRMIITNTILTRFSKYTLKRVGTKLGGRKHSTIINSIRSYNDLYKFNKGFRGKVLNVKYYINGI